jgi:hypothetical protein
MPVITAPRHFRMRGADLIACASCRFAGDLYPVKHRALQQFAGVERVRSSWT